MAHIQPLALVGDDSFYMVVVLQLRHIQHDVKRVPERHLLEKGAVVCGGHHQQLPAFVGRRFVDEHMQGLQHAVREAGADGHIVQQALKVVDDDHRQRGLVRVLEHLVYLRAFALLTVPDVGVRADNLDVRHVALQRQAGRQRSLATARGPLQQHRQQRSGGRSAQLFHQSAHSSPQLEERRPPLDDVPSEVVLELLIGHAKGGLDL
mmetsp:Transcript_23397/g.33044  ORF Transcript_23397/g.33044 Transcript_23397/m.33044 type:complete len:207 (-) Transcript_23397:1436-2056(-)